ncbi:hypothetical protein KJK41_03155 [Bacillus haikouensis]|nr:hypothetical protein KJK41_03155 [Bacillus haikouensis]
MRTIKMKKIKVVPKKDEHCKITPPPKGCGFFPTGPCENPVLRLDVIVSVSCEGIISGRILCDFRPLKGITVNLTSSFPGLVFENPNPVTDSSGKFSTQVTVVPGTPVTSDVVITATAQVGDLILMDQIVIRVDCIKCINPLLTLSPIPDTVSCRGTQLTGKLICDGVPISGALITFMIQPAINKVIAAPNPALTSVDGTYKAILVPFPDVDETITIIAKSVIGGQQVSVSRQVTVRCLKCKNLSITLNPMKINKINCRAAISGILSCDGQPLANRTVTLTGSPFLQFLPSNPVADEEGIFTFVVAVSAGTPFQPASIKASAMVDGKLASATVNVTAGCKPPRPVMTLELPNSTVTEKGAEISGQLTLEGFPLKYIEVELRSSENQGIIKESLVKTDEKGRFTARIQPQPGMKGTVRVKAIASVGKKKKSVKGKIQIDA